MLATAPSATSSISLLADNFPPRFCSLKLPQGDQKMTDTLIALAFIAMVLLPGIVASDARNGSLGNALNQLSR
jgi:hypothetical protein